MSWPRIADAARLHDLEPRDISFKGAVQTLTSYRNRGLLEAPSIELLATLLTAIAAHRVGNRADRVEPRKLAWPVPLEAIQVPFGTLH